MFRFISVGAAVVTLALLFVSDAVAQRDAAAKARGEFGRGFWDSGNQASRSQSFYYQPARPSVESYRSFSYEPVGINPGDTVSVSGDDIKMMKGSDIVGAIANGTKFKVTKVINGWLGAVVEVDGQKLNGWIWHKNVALDEQASSSEPRAADRSEAGRRTYRRFSYEPSPQRGYQDRQRTKPAWAYPKTDPRRYSR